MKALETNTPYNSPNLWCGCTWRDSTWGDCTWTWGDCIWNNCTWSDCTWFLAVYTTLIVLETRANRIMQQLQNAMVLTAGSNPFHISSSSSSSSYTRCIMEYHWSTKHHYKYTTCSRHDIHISFHTTNDVLLSLYFLNLAPNSAYFINVVKVFIHIMNSVDGKCIIMIIMATWLVLQL